MKWERMCVRKDAGDVGFRDLKDFNRALLVKQGWRIVNNPSCLIARVLKAEYFCEHSFLDSVPGDNPSAMWRR